MINEIADCNEKLRPPLRCTLTARLRILKRRTMIPLFLRCEEGLADSVNRLGIIDARFSQASDGGIRIGRRKTTPPTPNRLYPVRKMPKRLERHAHDRTYL